MLVRRGGNHEPHPLKLQDDRADVPEGTMKCSGFSQKWKWSRKATMLRKKKERRKSLPSKIMFVPEGRKIPVEKQKILPAEFESHGQWKVVADLSGYQEFFPIPTSKKV